jgi:hypothetical protein
MMERRQRLVLSIYLWLLPAIHCYVVRLDQRSARQCAAAVRPLGAATSAATGSTGGAIAADRWDRLNPKPSVRKNKSPPTEEDEEDDRGMSLNELKRRT